MQLCALDNRGEYTKKQKRGHKALFSKPKTKPKLTYLPIGCENLYCYAAEMSSTLLVLYFSYILTICPLYQRWCKSI